ncbi:uncharacterized protein LOC144577435 isoform X2 [Callithrix jacchus]
MATGQSQPPLPPLGDRMPGSCPRAALVGPAYPHPSPDRAALSHRLETRDPRPGPTPRSCSSGLRSGAGFKGRRLMPTEVPASSGACAAHCQLRTLNAPIVSEENIFIRKGWSQSLREGFQHQDPAWMTWLRP